MKIAIILSSVRSCRMADRVAIFTKSQLECRGHQTCIIDPREFALPALELPIHWYPDPEKAPANLQRLNKLICEADAYVILCAEYNRTIPSPLTNLLNHCCPLNFAYKAAGIVTYSQGPFAGTIAGSHLRDHLSELGCINLPEMSCIASVQKVLDPDGNISGCENLQGLDASVGRVVEQLLYVGDAMKRQRECGNPRPPKLHSYI